MEATTGQADWKCAGMASGKPCARNDSTVKMLALCAENWGSLNKVRHAYTCAQRQRNLSQSGGAEIKWATW